MYTDRKEVTPADTAQRQRLAPAEREQQIVEGAVQFFAEVGFDARAATALERASTLE